MSAEIECTNTEALWCHAQNMIHCSAVKSDTVYLHVSHEVGQVEQVKLQPGSLSRHAKKCSRQQISR